MTKAKPDDFLLNTDYEMDKIIYFKEGSIMPGEVQTIDHGLHFRPLLFGPCGFNSDFSDPKMSPYLQWTNNGSISFQYYATASQITINYTNDDNSSQKLYYRLYGFQTTGSTRPAPKTSGKAKTFIINTDYNYCKLYKKGYTNSDLTIEHNFGYIPLVLAWDSYGSPIWFSDTGGEYVAVTTSNVVIKCSSRVHYRIYYDEA